MFHHNIEGICLVMMSLHRTRRNHHLLRNVHLTPAQEIVLKIREDERRPRLLDHHAGIG